MRLLQPCDQLNKYGTGHPPPRIIQGTVSCYEKFAINKHSQPSISSGSTSGGSTKLRWKTVFLDPQLEIANVKGQLYALLYIISYKGREHP